MGWPLWRRMPGTGRVQTRSSSQTWDKREPERRVEREWGDEGTKGERLRNGGVGTGQRDAGQAADCCVLLRLSVREAPACWPEPRLESTGLDPSDQRLVIAL